MDVRWKAAWTGGGLPRWRRAVYALAALALASVIWFPTVHLLFTPALESFRAPEGLAPKARALAARQMELWEHPEARAKEIGQLRGTNAEWDFMGRTFLVLALANLSLREPSTQARNLAIMDAIIAETMRIEKEKGFCFFLMDYGRAQPFTAQPARSVFVDGEIALMLGARRMIEERAEYRTELAERVGHLVRQMGAGPVRCGESYPDECWMFCNTAALAAIRIHDALDGQDHGPFLREWVATAKRRLVHKPTGLLISSFSLNGYPRDGPEGSSIWMVAHCLQLVDEEFARDQYARAKKELARELFGFAYAREWPASWKGPVDVDSGPIVPGLEASTASSGLALLAAGAFEDRELMEGLLASLHLGGFPIERDGKLKLCASNQVGDAVVLYALTQGPLWRKVREGTKR